jgi:thioredoxin 1
MPIPATISGGHHNSDLVVACLCAAWCRTCDEYRPYFEQLQQEFAPARFYWIDIEDEADLVDPIEVDNFPTVLIARGNTAQFFGTVTPHPDTLRRLIQTEAAGNAKGLASSDLEALVSQLKARKHHSSN